MKLGPRASIALSLLVYAPASLAAAPVYFNLGGLFLLVLAVVFGLFLLVGGKKGFVAFIVLFGAFWAWGLVDQWLQTSRADTAREVISRACLRNAGATGDPLPQTPARIFVQIDDRLRSSTKNALRGVYVNPSAASSGIEYVKSPPPNLDASSAYVTIDVIQEGIEGAKGWYLNGIRAAVKDGVGATRATFVDYLHAFGWCLGNSQPLGIEHFLRSRTGVAVQLADPLPTSINRIAVRSPVGTVSSVERGRFSETMNPPYVNEENKAKDRIALLPHNPDCRFRAGLGPEYLAICREGSPDEYRVDLGRLSAVHQLPSSWLEFSGGQSDSRIFDSLSVVERGHQGAIIGRWHIRFPAIEAKGNSSFEVRNVKLASRRLTADLVFSRRTQFDVPPSSQAPYREWYEYRATVSATLIEEQ